MTTVDGSTRWRRMRPWRKALSILGTIFAVAWVAMMGMAFAVMRTSTEIPTWEHTWHLFGVLLSPLVGVAMIWRIRYPRVVFLIAVGTVLALPISPFGPAIALPWLMAEGNRRGWAWAIPAAALTTALPLYRDWRFDGDGSLFGDVETGELQLDNLSFIILWAVIFCLALAAGWVRYFAGKASQESATAQAHQVEARLLQSRLDRQEERDLIAREMHDTVAHHLSLVSLQAGLLEVTSTDEEVPETARAVRKSAHLALEEMRSLITSLRDSEVEGYAGTAPLLSQWQDLVRTTQDAGVEVSAEVNVDTEEMSAALARGAYRVLQESITNATKHAPGSGIGIIMTGDPARGLYVTVSNWVPRPLSRYAPPGQEEHETQALMNDTGSGTGIPGMTERAVSLGGTLSAGVENNQWIVRAWFPWA